MGLVSEQPPKYIPWKLLQYVRKAIKSGNEEWIDRCRFLLRSGFGIDWERKSLDLHTGQIICEWFNDRNIDRDYRE